MTWTRNAVFVLSCAVILAVGVLSAPVTKTQQKEPLSQRVQQQQNQDTAANELEGLLKHEAQKQETPTVQLPGAKGPIAFATKIETKVQQVARIPVNILPVSSQQMTVPEQTQNLFPVPEEFPTFEQKMEMNPVYSEEHQVDLSPRAVAEYLLVTKDFDGFNQALSDLIQSGVLSPAEVFQYKDTVSWQYEGLLSQLENTRRQYIQDMVRQDPLDYLSRSGPVYPDIGMSQNNLPLNNQPIDFPDLDIQAPDFNLQVPEFDMQPREFGNIQAIPVAERRTQRVQKLLLAKQQNLDGILDVVLNEYYNQPQEEYGSDYVDNMPPNYDVTDDTDLEQLMEYLQETISQPAGIETEQPAVNEEPSNVPESQEAPESNDIASELKALQNQSQEDKSQDASVLEETSGDGEEVQKSNETKANADATSS